ncbi:MAG: hypothetical protein LBO67_09650 [Spirochaetaceae bacterium]|jgi:hypothetical protein|nr:hypothetical protein [Spirochaetaceae bacterium]
MESCSLWRTIALFIKKPALRLRGLSCIKSLCADFFGLQYRLALRSRVPIYAVDHPLDSRIPFIPEQVGVYLHFVGFWVELLGALLRQYGEAAVEPVKDFVATMQRLYSFAAVVYRQALSTTERPGCRRKARLMLIHLFDPHLFCVPSLHIMVVISTYTQFRAIVQRLNREDNAAADNAAVRSGALAIAESVLYLKQHSINCVAAALYAMTRFDRRLFPPEEALTFAGDLFAQSALDALDKRLISAAIIDLYRRFCAEGAHAERWEEPLLHFLHQQKPVRSAAHKKKEQN